MIVVHHIMHCAMWYVHIIICILDVYYRILGILVVVFLHGQVNFCDLGTPTLIRKNKCILDGL